MRDVSVIIPVAGMTRELTETVQTLAALPEPVGDVVVAPNAALPGLPPSVRLLPTGSVGPAAKRNLAADAAAGTILAFLDDDAYPGPGWLPAALPHFADPLVAAVGGPAVTPPDDGFWAGVSGAVLTSWLGSGSARMRYWPVGTPRDMDDWPSVNLLVRRDAFRAVGGFNAAYWPGEDTALCLALRREGFRLLYEPRAVVFHHRATTPLRHLRQVARYGLHRGFFWKQLPETSRRLFYLLPSLGVFGSAVLLAIAAALPATRLVIGSLFVSGFLLAAFAGIREAGRRQQLLIALVFPWFLLAHHATYGAAFLRGLLSPRLKRYQRVAR